MKKTKGPSTSDGMLLKKTTELDSPPPLRDETFFSLGG